jgi:hypothetical protein
LIYINYDRFSPDALNRGSAWEGGGVVLAHEIGHYFGLLHSFEGGCNPPDDAVTDTPPNLDPESGWQPSWLAELTDWCKRFRHGDNPDPKLLMKYKSCPNRGGKDVIDNVFNMMSYLDDVCRMMFTENQVGCCEVLCCAVLRRPRCDVLCCNVLFYALPCWAVGGGSRRGSFMLDNKRELHVACWCLCMYVAVRS